MIDISTFNWLFLVIIIYIINLASIVYFNPLNIVRQYHTTLIILSIITGIINLSLWKFINFGSIITVLSALVILYGLLYSIYYFIIYTRWPLAIMIHVLNALFIVSLIALVYTYFSTKIFPNVGKSGKVGLAFKLLKYLIFYIPCLFIDLINFVKSEYKITAKTTVIILVIELIIIILRFLLPLLYKFYNHVDGYLIEKGPLYLNNETNLGTFQNKPIKSATKSKKKNFNYNYAISSWIWINPQPESTSEAYNESTSLLNYGDVLNINFNKNNLEFWALTTGDDKVTLDPNIKKKVYVFKNIQYQKWNNIILNYDGGSLDIFINNKLVSSIINITPAKYYNIVTSGANNGINGGIKEIIYYDTVLSKNDIYSIYSAG